jgi:hypothetical protein
MTSQWASSTSSRTFSAAAAAVLLSLLPGCLLVLPGAADRLREQYQRRDRSQLLETSRPASAAGERSFPRSSTLDRRISQRRGRGRPPWRLSHRKTPSRSRAAPSTLISSTEAASPAPSSGSGAPSARPLGREAAPRSSSAQSSTRFPLAPWRASSPDSLESSSPAAPGQRTSPIFSPTSQRHQASECRTQKER